MWNYKGKQIKDRSDLPKEAIGFVYKIHNWKESKYYIGKKILLNKRTKPPLKGYKRKRKVSGIEERVLQSNQNKERTSGVGGSEYLENKRRTKEIQRQRRKRGNVGRRNQRENSYLD